MSGSDHKEGGKEGGRKAEMIPFQKVKKSAFLGALIRIEWEPNHLS